MTLSPVVVGNVDRLSLTVGRCAGPAGAGMLVLCTVCFATRGDLRSGKCRGRDGGDIDEGIRSGVGPRDGVMRPVEIESFPRARQSGIGRATPPGRAYGT